MKRYAVMQKVGIVAETHERLAEARESKDDPVQAEVKGIEDGIKCKDNDQQQAGDEQGRCKEPFPCKQRKPHNPQPHRSVVLLMIGMPPSA